MGAFVNFSADWIAPGEIMFGGRGAVVLGEVNGRMTERLAALHTVMRDFEPNAIVTDAIWGYLWGKLGYGAMLFAQALGQSGMADTFARKELLPMFRALGREAVEVALAEGVDPKGFNGYDPAAFMPNSPESAARASIAAMEAFNRPNAKTHSGVWRDLAIRKRRTEVDVQIAPIAEIGATHGLDVSDHPQARYDDPRGGGRHATDDRRQSAGAAAPMSALGFRRPRRRGQRRRPRFWPMRSPRRSPSSARGCSPATFPPTNWPKPRQADRSRPPSSISPTGVPLPTGSPASRRRPARFTVLSTTRAASRDRCRKPLDEVPDEDWDRIFAINVGAAMVLSRAAAPGMKRARAGRVVNISSGAGMQASLTGIQAYCSAKHAVIGLTRQLAHEFGPVQHHRQQRGARLHPHQCCDREAVGELRRGRPEGAWSTASRMKRLGAAQDIANAVVFFASDLAGFVNGQVLSVDGGR